MRSHRNCRVLPGSCHSPGRWIHASLRWRVPKLRLSFHRSIKGQPPPSHPLPSRKSRAAHATGGIPFGIVLFPGMQTSLEPGMHACMHSAHCRHLFRSPSRCFPMQLSAPPQTGLQSKRLIQSPGRGWRIPSVKTFANLLVGFQEESRLWNCRDRTPPVGPQQHNHHHPSPATCLHTIFHPQTLDRARGLD